jgi:hypothetical protein
MYACEGYRKHLYKIKLLRYELDKEEKDVVEKCSL